MQTTRTRFRLNGEPMEFEGESGRIVLDWLRTDRGLTGTKEGCREGDCGACLVLLGEEPADGGTASVDWIPVTSCLLALDELDGRQLVTIEGLAAAGPTPVMLALHGENASQCGFCSPGFVVALTGRLIAGGPIDAEALATALEGNLCRCTGYGAIRRAADKIAAEYADLPEDFSARIDALAQRGVLPPALAAAMKDLPPAAGKTRRPRSRAFQGTPKGAACTLGGGTDWFVRHPDPEPEVALDFSDQLPELRHIRRHGAALEVGAAVSLRDFFASAELRALAPGIAAFEAEVASPPIRSRATLAGNIANASPVADLTAILLALDATLRLRNRHTGGIREIALRDFFLGYKKTAADRDERIEAILLPGADAPRLFSFEKAAKRARLDIAAVNTAFSCRTETRDGMVRLRDVRLSAGGVGPTPLYLAEAAAFAEGKAVDAALVRRVAALAVAGISPISDARGSAAYRRAILERFVMAHFLRLFPQLALEEALF